ncbi:MAG: hypothetical protein WCK65_11165 [Rhodospirillaceae bacterium]
MTEPPLAPVSAALAAPVSVALAAPVSAALAAPVSAAPGPVSLAPASTSTPQVASTLSLGLRRSPPSGNSGNDQGSICSMTVPVISVVPAVPAAPVVTVAEVPRATSGDPPSARSGQPPPVDAVEARLRETARGCLVAYRGWRLASGEASILSLNDAVHNLRKVLARIEIDMSANRRDEPSLRPIPIPQHRAARPR